MSRRAAMLHPSPASGFARPAAEPRYAPDLGLEPTHLELAATVDVFAGSLRGRVTHTLTCRTAGWRTLTLDAVALDDLAVEGSHPLTWRYDGDRVHVRFADAPAVGDTRTVTVTWAVTRPLTGLVCGASDPDKLGEAPVFVATDHETERARYWLPCVDHPTVRPTLQIAIRADARFTALANGAQVSLESHDDGAATTTWRLDSPCPSYLLCFVVGDLVRFSEEPLGEVPVEAWAPRPFTPDHLRLSFDGTRDLITWVTGRLGRALPWPKYSQFAAAGVGGAMENISLVSWDDAFVADQRLRDEFGYLIDIVNLHELTHTWFGDRVVCRDFAHSWLKESWATYMETVWLEETQGADVATSWFLVDHRVYTDEADSSYVRPIQTRRFDSSWDLFDAHLYPGGAWRLHMLRHRVGDDAFWAGTRDYLDRFEGQVAESDDFRRCMERASGRSLARFFEQWFESPGYPKLKAKWSFDGDKGHGTLTIEQTQQDESAGVGFFDISVEVALEAADGAWSRHAIDLDGRTGALVVALDAAPKQVVVDPDSHLLHGLEFDPGRDLLERTLTHSDSLRGKLHAVATLCKKGRPAGIASVEAAYRDEPLFLQRRHYARALGESGSPAALAALVRLLDHEADPQVMSALTDALGRYRDKRAAWALEAWLERPERPYRAAAAALVALGKQRDPALVPLLVAHSRNEGWWGWTQRGALQGLGQTGALEAYAHLREVVAGETVRASVLPAAVEALGACARWLEAPLRAQAGELLADRVRHDQHAVRLAAGRGLLALREPAGVATLRRLREHVSVQHQASIDRLRDKLAKAGSTTATTRLEGQVSTLTDQLRDLQERLDKLEAAAPDPPAPPAKG